MAVARERAVAGMTDVVKAIASVARVAVATAIVAWVANAHVGDGFGDVVGRVGGEGCRETGQCCIETDERLLSLLLLKGHGGGEGAPAGRLATRITGCASDFAGRTVKPRDHARAGVASDLDVCIDRRHISGFLGVGVAFGGEHVDVSYCGLIDRDERGFARRTGEELRCDFRRLGVGVGDH